MKAKMPSFDSLSLRDTADRLLYRYRSGARGDLLENVQYTLLLFENTLLDAASGECREVEATAGQERAAALAAAARGLIPASAEPPSVALLLPPTDFVATSYDMAVHGESMVRSALELQGHSLIPSYEDELLLAVDASRSRGVALWYPAPRADQLFHALHQQGLFLTALMPRSLALADSAREGDDLLIQDEDSRHITLVLLRDGALRSLITVSRRDLEQDAFARQWEEQSAQLEARDSLRCASLADWTGLRRKVECRPNATFLPSGARRLSRQLDRRRRRKLGLGAAAAALVLLCLPFLASWIQVQRLENRMADFQARSLQARESQGAVLALEEEWGVLNQYPRQEVATVLLTLNEVIEYSLTSLQINRGVVDIEGYAQDPAYLVELLAEMPLFYNVTQSRQITGGNSASRGNRFGIRMNLSGVDFEQYIEQYPMLGE